MSDTTPSAPPAGTVTSGHPVQLTIGHQPHYSRGLAVLGCLLLYGRIIALIPVLIVLYILAIVASLLAWIMQFGVLFTGRYPEGPHRFLTGFLRLSVRTQAWAFGLTDRYPGFSLQP